MEIADQAFRNSCLTHISICSVHVAVPHQYTSLISDWTQTSWSTVLVGLFGGVYKN